MGDEELVKRLRNPIRFAHETQQQARDRHFVERHTAADRIEALQAERDAAGALYNNLLADHVTLQARIAQLEAELAAAREKAPYIVYADKVRADALEEAAKVAEGHRTRLDDPEVAERAENIATAIRALKDHPHD